MLPRSGSLGELVESIRLASYSAKRYFDRCVLTELLLRLGTVIRLASA